MYQICSVKHTLSIIFFLFCGSLFAQEHQLEVKVVENGNPLAYASVGIQSLKQAAHSNEFGVVIFTKLPAGKYLVEASLVGYERNKVWVEIGKVRSITIHLKSLQTTLHEVSVSGTLSEVSKSQSPVPVEIYSHAFFKKNPTSNLFESIQLINGVQPTLNCNVCNTGDIHINGLEGPYTLVLIDGMPIVSALSTVYGLSGIPNSLIERVEVVKGPAASLYGSEAVGGLINVITKSPKGSPSFSIDYLSGKYWDQNVDVGYQIKRGKHGLLLSGNYFAFNNRVDLNHDNFTDLALQNRVSIFGKYLFQRTPKLQSSLAARVYYEDRFGGEMNWRKQFRGGDSVYGESVYTKRYELLGLHPFFFGKQKFRLQFSFNQHQQNSAYGTTLFIAKQSSWFNQLLYDTKWGNRQQLLLGAALRATSYDDNTAATGLHSNLTRTFIPGIFVQDEIALHSAHTLLLGARLDYYQAHGLIFSPRINHKISLPKGHTIRLSAGNGFRVVNVFTEDHAALTGAREVVIEQGLKPERSWNMNIQYNKWVNAAFGFVEMDMSVFYTRFQNKIIPNYDSDPNKIIYANTLDHAVSKGITINAEASFQVPFKMSLGLTLMDVFTQQMDSLQRTIKLQQIHAPAFSGTYVLSYQWKALGVSTDLTGQVYGPMRLPVQPNDFRPSYSPWFSLMNLQISKKMKSGLELYGGVKNVLNYLPQNPIMRWFDPFDKQAADPVSNPNGYTFDTGYNYAPMQARRLFFGLRYTFTKP